MRVWTRLLAIAVLVVLSLYLLFYYNPVLLTRLNQSDFQIERRVQYWNFKDTSEEIYCRAAHDLSATQNAIPNVVHFILLANEGVEIELTYPRFLALKAAVVRMNATQINLHTTGLNTENIWWQQISKHVTLVPVDRKSLKAPGGVPLASLAVQHQADLLRLAILMREGGIYLDTDVYALKPFHDLLSNPRDILMGHEGGNRYGLCNAVIVARAESEFLSLWHDSYKSFDPDEWNEHSVRIPKKLQVQHRELICPLSPSVFFWPTWTKMHSRYMHEEELDATEVGLLEDDIKSFGGGMYANQLAYHAWNVHGVLNGLSHDTIQSKDTRFHVLLRDIANAPL